MTLTSDIISSFLYLKHISFITNNFPQMCLLLDLFLWGIRYVTLTCLVEWPFYTSFTVDTGTELIFERSSLGSHQNCHL